MNETSKERREPGKIYHVRNNIGRKNLFTSGRMNELTHVLWTEYIRFVSNALWLTQTGLDSTTLHYLAVWQAMVSVLRTYI